MQKDPFKRMYWYLGTFMAILIFFFGIMLIATDVAYEMVPQPNRKWIAIVFLIYSVFRGLRAYQQFKQFNSQDDE